MKEYELIYQIRGAIYDTYNALGPGLLESVYEKALVQELRENGLSVQTQMEVQVNYKGMNIGEGLRLDLLVNDELIVELKSVDEFKPVHYKQLLTYLKLMNKRVGLLINFNTDNLRDGIKRVVNDY